MAFDINAVKRRMLVKYPFFGSVVANINYKETKKIGMAGTDGLNIYYNPDSMQKLNLSQQTFIVAHEVCHIAFNHIIRSEGKKKRLWNIATDGVINQLLKKDGLEFIDNVVDIEEAINYKVWLFGHYHADRIERPGVEQYFKSDDDLEMIFDRWNHIEPMSCFYPVDCLI